MPFMQQDTRPVLNADGSPQFGPDGPVLENIGEPYECVWILDMTTGQVTPQSAKAALTVFADRTRYRLLKDQVGRSEWESQSKNARRTARFAGRLAEMEEDWPEASDIADANAAHSDTPAVKVDPKDFTRAKAAGVEPVIGTPEPLTGETSTAAAETVVTGGTGDDSGDERSGVSSGPGGPGPSAAGGNRPQARPNRSRR